MCHYTTNKKGADQKVLKSNKVHIRTLKPLREATQQNRFVRNRDF